MLGDTKVARHRAPSPAETEREDVGLVIIHVRGKVHVGPNAMSRYALGPNVRFIIARFPVHGSPTSENANMISRESNDGASSLPLRSCILAILSSNASTRDTTPDSDIDVSYIVIAAMYTETRAIAWSW